MPLRMTIAAVISLGLTVGAFFVTGQAAQQPPRVADPASVSKPASSDPDGRIDPPRVASPQDLGGPGAGGTAQAAPPRVVEPGSTPSASTLPLLPGDDAPPAVAQPTGGEPRWPAGVDDLGPPDVLEPPAIASPSTESSRPLEPPDAMSIGLDEALPPDVADASDAAGGEDDLIGNLSVFPAAVQFEGVPEADPSEPLPAPDAAPPFHPGQDALGMELPMSAGGLDFTELEPPGPAPETAPAKVRAQDDDLPEFGTPLPDPQGMDVPGLGDDPMFGVPAGPPGGADPTPVDDPFFVEAAPLTPQAAPDPQDDPLFSGSFPGPNETAPAPAQEAPPKAGGATSIAPEFSSTEPPSDFSLRTSAAPRDAVGSMAESLGERFSEGPREIGLNLDVAMPQTSNINLPMKAVITLRNDGRDDVFDVVVRLPLPDGLEFQEASPQPDEQAEDGRSLVWRWATLAPSDTRSIDLVVKPVRAVPMDLVPRVTSVMAAKSRTTVQEPKLKIDLVGPNVDPVKGSVIDFSIQVRNVGNGPARRVNLVATLTGGLKGYDDNGALVDAPRFEQMIGDLAPGDVFGPVPLTVLADGEGSQSCTIEAISADVVPATPVSAKPVNVVMPKLDLVVVGPESRPVGSMAEYAVTITNQGTRHATDVAVALFAPESGEPEVPKDAKYHQNPDKRLHSIYWRIPRLDKGESRTFRVPIRLDRIALYTVEAAAHSEGFRDNRDTQRSQMTTKVMGIPDIKIVDVTRKDPVIDSGEETQFEIQIKNIGSSEANNVYVDFYTNEWITVERTDPPNADHSDENPYHYEFSPIDRLAPGADRTFVVTVKAAKPGPAVANFDVHVYWDGLPESAAVRSNNHVRIAEGQVARSGGNAPK